LKSTGNGKPPNGQMKFEFKFGRRGVCCDWDF
jgi:hypothetical protein